MQSLGVLSVDDHPIVRLGIETLLKSLEGFHWLGAATSLSEAFQKVRELRPALVVLDLMLAGASGLELVTKIVETAPDTRVIIFSALEEDLYAAKAFEAGAMGFVSKDSGYHALSTAIKKVAAGEPYASESFKISLLKSSIGNRRISPLQYIAATLSKQEITVFRLIGSGLTTAEVARQLGVSSKTVGTYRERIKNKLNFQDARELERNAEAFFREELLAAKSARCIPA